MLRVTLRSAVLPLTIAAALPLATAAQTPAPFPRPGQPPAPRPPVASSPESPQPAAAPQPTGDPTEASLGVPVYPGSQFVASYDAGMGQRYYLFGTAADFAQIVAYYKTMLKQKGDLVFEEPPVHMFDIGKYREESMAMTPSVTVKDYTWGGSQGYLNPKRGTAPERFKTIIQIVPVSAPR
jgi:hypothetical protein